MKIIHWTIMPSNAISGLLNKTRELHLNEKALGFESHLCSPDLANKNGGIISSKFKFSPWSVAYEKDAVNVVQSHAPPIIDDLKNVVFIAHGLPEHSIYNETLMKVSAMSIAMNLVERADLVICWQKRHQDFWVEHGGDKVVHVPCGVDLERWSLEGERINFLNHPTVTYMGMWRIDKYPTLMLYAAKKAKKELKSLRIELINVPADNTGVFWMKLLCKLGIESYTEQFVQYLVSKPANLYRSVDMIVETELHGDMSTTSVEALACGCPVLAIKGSELPATAKCGPSPSAMAKGLIKIWNQMKGDPMKFRAEQRKLAVKYYDIKDTVKGLVKQYEKLLEV